MQYDVEILIDFVKEEPCLWNTTSRAYKEQNKKRNAWSKIGVIFGKDDMSFVSFASSIPW